jgi:hypothetical protein
VLIKENRQITVREIALNMGISYRSALAIVYNDLSYHKICARWVPPQLTEEHKQTHLWISEGFLQRHSQEGENLLH